MTEKTWLDKLCEPLEHPKYPQIKGVLVKIGYNDQIIGKCAEGEIGCQNNISYEVNQGELNPTDFINIIGVPDNIFNNAPCLLKSVTQNRIIDFMIESEHTNLSDLLINMNDTGFKYHEIAEFLRITYGDLFD